MHIHSYQIHNVLDLYRRQLSHRSKPRSAAGGGADEKSDMVQISPDGGRKIIMEKVSAEIVDRIVHHDGQPEEFREAAGRADEPLPGIYRQPEAPQGQFTYTLVDEKNRKLIHTLTLNAVSPESEGTRNTDPSADLRANGVYY